MDIQFWIDNADSFFHQIFMIVMGGLLGIAYLFGTTYNVVNIFVYYLFIPFSWIYLISKKTTVWINSVSIIILVLFLSFPDIKGRCDFIFDKSVDFLNYTADIFGSNYIDMSVYICVIIVSLIYLALIIWIFSRKTVKILMIIISIIFALYMIIIYPNFKDFLLYGLGKTVH